MYHELNLKLSSELTVATSKLWYMSVDAKFLDKGQIADITSHCDAECISRFVCTTSYRLDKSPFMSYLRHSSMKNGFPIEAIVKVDLISVVQATKSSPWIRNVTWRNKLIIWPSKSTKWQKLLIHQVQNVWIQSQVEFSMGLTNV